MPLNLVPPWMLQNGVLPARGGTSLSGIFLPPWQKRGCAPGRDRRTSWCAPRDYRKARPYHPPDGRAANPVATGGSCEAARPLHPCCTPPLDSPLTSTSLGQALPGERPSGSRKCSVLLPSWQQPARTRNSASTATDSVSYRSCP